MKLKRWVNALPIVLVVLIISWRGWEYFRQTQSSRPDYEDPTATQTQSQLIQAGGSAPQSETWQVVPGSVYDGDTLRVQRGVQELKIRFCGIDAPEKKQPRGIESRDYLRSLIAKGDGSVMLTPIEKDLYGRTVAELFVRPRPGKGYQPGEEIYLNGAMVQAGLAYHYERYSDNCENRDAIAAAEEIAQANGAGVWSDAAAVKPWEWRRAGR